MLTNSKILTAILPKGQSIVLETRLQGGLEGSPAHFDGSSFGLAVILTLVAFRKGKLLSPIVATGQLQKGCVRPVDGMESKTKIQEAFNTYLSQCEGRPTAFVLASENADEVAVDRRHKLVRVASGSSLDDQLTSFADDSRVFDPFTRYRNSNSEGGPTDPATASGDVVSPDRLAEQDEAVVKTANFGDDPKPLIDPVFTRHFALYRKDEVEFSLVPSLWKLQVESNDPFDYSTLARQILESTEAIVGKEAANAIDPVQLEIALRYYPQILRVFVWTDPSSTAPLYEKQKLWFDLIAGQPKPNERLRVLRFVASDLMHAEFLRESMGESLLYRRPARAAAGS